MTHFHSKPQPLDGLHPTAQGFFSLAQNAMKKFIVRFWFTAIIVVVSVMELMWLAIVMSGNGTGKSSPVTVFLFPVLLVVGTVSHFRRNK